MSKSIEEQLRERIAAHLKIGSMEPLDDQVALSRIMADVSVGLVLARREGHISGVGTWSCSAHETKVAASRFVYPLPMRTRRVLREEPVPGTDSPKFRVRDGVLEWSVEAFGWRTYAAWIGMRDGVQQDEDWARVRHALDLHDNPDRTEEVPADESNPWPEIEP